MLRSSLARAGIRLKPTFYKGPAVYSNVLRYGPRGDWSFNMPINDFEPNWPNAVASYRVKVIVMEDAERLLWRRDGDNREAVSSVLNIADGLIGRMLRLHR